MFLVLNSLYFVLLKHDQWGWGDGAPLASFPCADSAVYISEVPINDAHHELIVLRLR